MVTIKDKAEKAKNKKAQIGEDIDLNQYERANIDDHEKIDSLSDLSKDDKETLKSVGVINEDERAASFLQMDQSEVLVKNMYPGVEIMSIQQALDKYSWVKDYMWKAVSVDADKYTANTELGAKSGYFIRGLPGAKLELPIQACMYIENDDVQQTAHNIIIAEPGSEINIITGCSTAKHVDRAMHVGVSEFYLKENSKVTFTMIHNWAQEVDVRPRTGVIMNGDNSTYISNYILAKPVRNIQAYPTAYANGDNTKVFFQSILAGKEDSVIDQGSRTMLKGRNSQTEMITRAISEDESTIYTRGDLVGLSPDVKGHLECMGLLLSEKSKILSIPELRGESTDMELSHEAAVGKIAEDEIQYLMARGLTEDEAASMIVRGFLDIDIKGLPEELARETKRLTELSLQGM